MKWKWWFIGIASIAAALLTALLWFVFTHNLASHNFGVVEEGVLYRSAAPNEVFLREICERYRIATIVVLTHRIPAHEERIVSELGITIAHFPMSARRTPKDETVDAFLAVINDSARQPVLVHCRAGADRTGVLVASKRMAHDGWTHQEAMEEMSFYSHISFLHPHMSDYLKQRFSSKSR